MKKLSEFLKPFLNIIFGAVLLLAYLDFLLAGGAGLALGIVAVVIAACYLAHGILSIVLGSKYPEKLKGILDIVSVGLFPIFMFVYYLITTINMANAFGITAWIVAIISLAASIGFACSYLLAAFLKKKGFARIAFLFSAIFVLALVLNIVYVYATAAVPHFAGLGEIKIIELVIDVLYVNMLIHALPQLKVEEPVLEDKGEEPAEEPAE